MQHRPYMRSFRQIQKDIKKSYGGKDLKITKGTWNNPTVGGNYFSDDSSKELNEGQKLDDGRYNPTLIDYEDFFDKDSKLYTLNSQGTVDKIKHAISIGEAPSEVNENNIIVYKEPTSKTEWNPLLADIWGLKERSKKAVGLDTVSNNDILLGNNSRPQRNGRLVLEMPYNMKKLNASEDVHDFLAKIINDGGRWGNIQGLLNGNLSSRLQSQAMKYILAKEGINLDADVNGNNTNTLEALNKVMQFIPPVGENKKDNGFFQPGKFANITVAPELDNPNGVGHGFDVRFHEAMHGVIHAARSLLDDSIFTDDNIRYYGFDTNAYDGMRDMVDNRIVRFQEDFRSFYKNVINDKTLTRSTKNLLLGDLIVIPALLNRLVNGVDKNKLKKLSARDLIPLPLTSKWRASTHTPSYFLRDDNIEDNIALLSNELFAELAEVQASGNLFNKNVQKLIPPKIIKAYSEYLKTAIDYLPYVTDQKSRGTLSRQLFRFYNDPDLQKFLKLNYGINVKKSKSFKEMLNDKIRAKWGA